MIYCLLLTAYCLCQFFPNLDLAEKSSIPTSLSGLATIELNPPEVQTLIQSGLEFSYVEEFDSASFYFNKIIEAYPDNPAGYFFKAALIQLAMMDGCHFYYEKEYLSLMKKVTNTAQGILKIENNNWAEFYLGSGYAYRAVYEGLKGNYLETFNYGVKGGRILQNLIKEDSTFYETYLGCGTFEYFWARAARYLPILKLAGGNIEEAIRKLRIAARKSFYSGPTAKNSLVFICGEEGRFDEATSIIDTLLAQYPNSKTFLWNKAELEFKKKNYYTAIESYNNLYARYDAQNDKNYSNLAQCKLFIGKCFYELKERESARQSLKEVINYKKYSDKYPKIKQYCREAYALLSRLL